MPTYEYLCKKCGHTFEEFQSMSGEPLSLCPACGTDNLARVMGTGGGFILKGSGFYGTDYRKQQPGAGDTVKKDAEKKEKGKKQKEEREERHGEKKETQKKETEKKETEKKEAQKTGREKKDGGKGTPGSQSSSTPPPSGPPEKKD